MHKRYHWNLTLNKLKKKKRIKKKKINEKRKEVGKTKKRGKNHHILKPKRTKAQINPKRNR